MGDTFQVCIPDQRRAKGLHGGGCPHPAHCIKDGACYYGAGEAIAPTPTPPPDGGDREALIDLLRERFGNSTDWSWPDAADAILAAGFTRGGGHG